MLSDGHAFLERGGRDTWDCGSLCGSTPVFIGNEMYMYYSGTTATHEKAETLDMWRNPGSHHAHIGLATLKRGRYAGFSTVANTGTLITVPITKETQAQPQLHINAAVGEGGSIRVSLVDSETHEPFSGFSSEECVPITDDGAAVPVQWRNGKKLPEKPFCVKCELNGKNTKIYGLSWR